MPRAAPHLRVVNNANGHDLTTKRWQGDSDTLFHRRQIKKGTRIICDGRIDHGAIFVVDEIRTHRTGRGQWSEDGVPVRECKHLDDEVVLKKVGSNQFRTIRFSSLSYLSVWRLL